MATVTTPSVPAPAQGIVKNLLIKDSTGKTQLIEVIQTGPGKFMTMSGHPIRATTGGAGGVKTVIKTAAPQQQARAIQQGQNIIITSSPGGASFANIVQSNPGGQIFRAASPGSILKTSSGKQVLGVPIKPAPASGSPTSPIFRAATIKTEFGSPQRTTIVHEGFAPNTVGAPIMQQIIHAGNQRLLLTQTPNGPQLTPLSQLSGTLSFIAPSPSSSSPSTNITTTNMSSNITTSNITSSNMSNNSNSSSGMPTVLNISGSKQSFISPILDHTGARKRVDFPSDVSFESKRRKSEKGGKGLRHFSMKVCEKVRNKGCTTYNEVADELVSEFASPSLGLSCVEQQFDQKNIRRRVYDALNVLMAMNIISKEKKEIKWLGLPTNSMQECTTLEKDRQKRIERLQTKTQQLHDLIIQQVAFKSLIERNKERERETGPPPPQSSIHLPFLIVNTAKQTVIDCSISNDKMEYLFNFDGTFEIHDDIEILKRMGLSLGLDRSECSDTDLASAKRLLPKALAPYVDQIGRRTEDWKADFSELFDYEGLGGDIENVENVYGGGLEELDMEAAIHSLRGGEEMEEEEEEEEGSEIVKEEDEDEESFGDGDEAISE